jgi:hypothetical protein
MRTAQPFGERHYAAKLTEEDVRSIRRSKEMHATLARRYKVGERTIRDVRNNITWKDTR